MSAPGRNSLQPTVLSDVLILVGVLLVVTVPWLGETYFNSKGEPREAIVAMSMLRSGDWVLPVSYGGDIPYKPPFLAWLIAIFSTILNGGIVNEFCSRLPSALALIAMVAGFFTWLRQRVGRSLAFTSALVLATSFEVFRSGVICRVDMVLTCCIVLSQLLMHTWREQRRWWLWPPMVLLLSGAVLTKGPVGALLPCLAMGIYCLVKKDNFYATLLWLTALCIASMILPALWYVAAYRQGGEQFLNLAFEENIGRLTGSMGYDSHVNPWYYNLLTLLWGMLPWTLTVIVGLCITKRKKNLLSDVGVFSLTVSLTVLIFYCIPQSKRSVYLLPMYPFMAYGVGVLIQSLDTSLAFAKYARVWAWIIFLCIILALCAALFFPAKLSIQPIHLWQWPLALLAVGICVYIIRSKFSPGRTLLSCTLVLYFFYLSVAQPLVLNPKSDRQISEKVQTVADAPMPIYSLIEDSLMRYYTLNYYMHDRLRRLESADTSNLRPPFAVLVQEQMISQLPSYTSLPFSTDTLTLRSCDNRRGIVICLFLPPNDSIPQ